MRTFSRLAFLAVVLALTLPGPAGAIPVLNLGDFESGSSPGWLQTSWVVGNPTYWSVVVDGDASPESNTSTYPPSGLFQIVSDATGVYGTAVLYRDFVVPANADSLKLRLWYRSSLVSDMPNLEPSGQGQGLRVDLMSPAQPILGMAGILATPFATTSYPVVSADDFPPRTIALALAAWRGTTVRLRIAALSNTAPMVAGLDDVRLEGNPFVEVVTSLPALSKGAADWGDYDGDGDLDLAIMGLSGATRTTSIWRNNAGTLVKLLDLPVALEGGDIKWLDLDRDGDMDLVASGVSATGNTREVGINQGGVFTWSTVAGGWGRSRLDLADCDQDGDDDIAGGPTTSGSVMRNTAGGLQWDGNTLFPTPLDSTKAVWDPGVYPGLSLNGTFGVPQRAFAPNVGGVLGHFSTPTQDWAVSAGEIQYGDADADGQYEYFLAGHLAGCCGGGWLEAMVAHVNGFLVGTDMPKLGVPAAAWCDADADGDLDLLVAGNNSGARYTSLELWNAGAMASAGLPLPAVFEPCITWADYDGDGDPDFLLMGQGASGPITKLYRNDCTTTNAPPAAPSTFVTQADASTFWAGFLPPADDHTPGPGLTWDALAGTSPGGNQFMASQSDPVTGARRTTREGALRNTHFFGQPLATMLARRTPFYLRMQAIDGARKGSPWSPETIVSMGGWLRGVTDVPGDQGGAVRLRIRAGMMDTTASAIEPILQYTIWQRVAGALPGAALAGPATAIGSRLAPAAGGAPIGLVQWQGRTFLRPESATAASFPPGTWEAVANFNALQQPEYFARVSTVADSGATGANWSVFVVTSHSNSLTTWWVSPADSGKSLDNIAPGVPQGLTAHYHTGAGNSLSWQPTADADFQYYRVYRGATPGFAIGAGTLAANVASPAWSDPASDLPGVYYQVSAVDHNGNESAAAAPGVTTDAPASALPQFALQSPRPSPFARTTTIRFTLPAAGPATLEVFDAGGRRVRTLVRGRSEAGAHSVVWDGRFDGGERASSGLYFVRLRASERVAVGRVVNLP